MRERKAMVGEILEEPTMSASDGTYIEMQDQNPGRDFRGIGTFFLVEKYVT